MILDMIMEFGCVFNMYLIYEFDEEFIFIYIVDV